MGGKKLDKEEWDFSEVDNDKLIYCHQFEFARASETKIERVLAFRKQYPKCKTFEALFNKTWELWQKPPHGYCFNWSPYDFYFHCPEFPKKTFLSIGRLDLKARLELFQNILYPRLTDRKKRKSKELLSKAYDESLSHRDSQFFHFQEHLKNIIMAHPVEDNPRPRLIDSKTGKYKDTKTVPSLKNQGTILSDDGIETVAFNIDWRQQDQVIVDLFAEWVLLNRRVPDRKSARPISRLKKELKQLSAYRLLKNAGWSLGKPITKEISDAMPEENDPLYSSNNKLWNWVEAAEKAHQNIRKLG